MQPLISVIVPVYKVEGCIVRCLDSLRRQSLTDIEIIMVDDASPDRCGKICEEYATKDTRFKVFHNHKNRGLSAARNLGIGYATSDYLMFVDSDDWVHNDFCKEAYECAVRYQADLVMFDHIKINKHGNYIRCGSDNDPIFSEGYKTGEEAMDLVLSDGGNSAWNKLYKKELFEGISYPEGYLFEDTGTTYKLVAKASRVYYLDKALYYYCLRDGSISTIKSKKMIEDRVNLNLQRYRDLIAWGFNSERLDYRIKFFALWYCLVKKRDISNPNDAFLVQMLRSDCIPKRFTWLQKMLVIMFKYCPSLFEEFSTLCGMKIC